jgi:hypothetical protein
MAAVFRSMVLPFMLTSTTLWGATPNSMLSHHDTAGVVIVEKFPAQEFYATEGKMVSAPGLFDDGSGAREERIEEARNLKRYIQIDTLPKKMLDQKRTISFTGLDMRIKHLFREYDVDGLLKCSFYFSFAKGCGTTERLSYSPAYATWRIAP